MLHRLFANATEAHAHCDLYCGVYDPAQAKIDALSCLKTIQKYHDSDDDHFKARCIFIKEQRAEEVKHHLMVLWADFFTKDHFEQFPNLHQLFWDGVHGAGDVKKSLDAAVAEKLLKTIDEISDIFWQTDKGKQMGVYPPPVLQPAAFFLRRQYRTISARMPSSTSAMTPARRQAII
jgi:nickel superoxide dismutase